MNTLHIDRVNTLTFDLFGTVLDLSGSLVPAISGFLDGKGASVDADELWVRWRARQRVEQYQDTILMLGHSGYLETCRRGLLYTLRQHDIPFADAEIDRLMSTYRELTPFADAVRGLNRLKGSYRLVALSNGEPWLLDHLVQERIDARFDAVISVEEAGAFKPHPSVYRTAARILGSEPHEIMMVAAHSFDIMGARACGFRGAFVNRYGLPFEETGFQPDITVDDFNELAARLLDAGA
jgi:2-haloacid dehalogenase